MSPHSALCPTVSAVMSVLLNLTTRLRFHQGKYSFLTFWGPIYTSIPTCQRAVFEDKRNRDWRQRKAGIGKKGGRHMVGSFIPVDDEE